MNTLEILAIRKAIKTWRDRWTEQIAKDLEESIPELRSMLVAEVDVLKPADALRTKHFAAEKLQPLFADWCQKKEKELFTAAEEDLQNQFKRTIAYRSTKGEIDVDVSKDALLNVAGAALSGAATVATIPAIVIFSSATVSAGGILGLLGVTTTVVVTKNIVIGVIVFAALMLMTLWRFSKAMASTKARLREQIEQQIQERIVYSKKQPSLILLLTTRVEDTAKQLLGELNHAA